MYEVAQIDIACNDPAAVAKWYAKLLDIEAAEVAKGIYSIQLDGAQLHFPPRSFAGIDTEAKGIHQLQLQSDLDLDALKSRCEAESISYEVVIFAGPGEDICAWDPEGNPVLIKPRR